jgi:hypothetical protein
MAGYSKVIFVTLMLIAMLAALSASAEPVTITVITFWQDGDTVKELPAQFILLIQRLYGDADGDGVVTSKDVLMVFDLFLLKHEEPSPSILSSCDVRPKPGANGKSFGDGRIQSDDVCWIVNYLLGKVQEP